MLILTRRVGESIIVGEDVEIRVISVQGSQVRLGIDAPPEVRVDRLEIRQRKDKEINGNG